MFEGKKEKAEELLKMASLLGKSTIIGQVQSMLVPYIIEIFGEHDHTDLKRMILTDYDLVETQTPDNVRKALKNVGSSPQTRSYFESLVMDTITPENILTWLRNPKEWLDEEASAKERTELRRCAKVIENTDGGEEWLERQVLDIYRIAEIIPEDTKTVKPTD